MEKTDSTQKILLEKRKRHQTYMAVDYLLSVGTYFDFLSVDAFKLSKTAKFLAHLSKTKTINSDLLFLAYFYNDSRISNMLEKFEFSTKLTENIEKYFPKIDFSGIAKTKFKSDQNLFEQFFSKIFNSKAEDEVIIPWSHEVIQLLEKAIENSLLRFKTPVLTPEILFITLMEEKSGRINQIIKKCFRNEMDWYLFRYELIKLIHHQESSIRGEVTKNQQYFAYLMKTELSDSEFKRLLDTTELPKGVLTFRNHLILELLKTNLFENLLKDINLSIKLNKKRLYSS